MFAMPETGDRPVSRCRRDPVSQSVPRADRPLSRADRRAARRRRTRSIAASPRISCRATGCRRWSRRCAGIAWRAGDGARAGRRGARRRSPPIPATRRWRRAARAIDRCFAGDTVEAILDALAARRNGGRGDWAARDPRRAADQIADQPQGHAAPADRGRGLRHRGGADARIPADPAFHGRRTISTKACAPRWSTRTRSRTGSRRPSPR